MAGSKLTSKDFIVQIDAIALPSDVAFPHNGNAHAYTGPFDWIYKQYAPLIGGKIWNQERAARRANIDNELLINDSVPGKYLLSFHEDGMKGFGVYNYFEDIWGLPPLKAGEEGDKPWIHTSKLFIRSLWGNVSTTVCGADRKRIFYTLELPYMMAVIPLLINKMRKTKDIEYINEFSTKIFRNAFSAKSYEKSYGLICLTEKRKAFRRGLDSGNVEDYADYLDTLEMSILDHHVQGKDSKHPLNASVPEDERLAWKQVAMEDMANKSLRFIDAELGMRPKKIIVVPAMPKGFIGGPK